MTTGHARWGFVLLAWLVAGSAMAQQQSEPGTTTTADTHGGNAYISDHERGWFWYERRPDPPPPLPPTTPPPGSPANPDPPPLSVAWLRIHLEQAREIAIDNPTRENVEYYNYLQKITLDKAERFAQVSVQTNTLNPTLDETVQNPVSTAQRNARRDTESQSMHDTMTAMARDFGIFYIFKSDCPYCRREDPLLLSMQQNYGFHVLPISIDHRGLLDGSFPNWVPDRGQASSLNVTGTPTLYLFRPPNTLVFLSVGLQSMPELRERILTVARSRNWIDQNTFDLAMRGATHDLFIEHVDPSTINWDDPHEALSALKALSNNPEADGTASGIHLDQATPLSLPGGTP